MKKTKLLLILLAPVSCSATVTVVSAGSHKIEFEYTAHAAHLRREADKYKVPSGLLAGLIYTESRWNSNAKSPVGASGAAQFMPATAKWLTNKYPSVLYPMNTADMNWSITAAALYLRLIMDNTGKLYTEECHGWGATLSSYNGGEGWAQKRFNKTPVVTRQNFWQVTRKVNPGILASAQKENEEYPVRIYLAQDFYKQEGSFCKHDSVYMNRAVQPKVGVVEHDVVKPAVLSGVSYGKPAILRRRVDLEEQQCQSRVCTVA